MLCQYCEKRIAKGGHRFCYGCLGEILNQRRPIEKPSWMASTYLYPPIKRKSK